jgi:hypothetical protein
MAVWTHELADEAKAKSQFVLFDRDQNGQLTVAAAVIPQAKIIWKTNPDVVFMPIYRSAGTASVLTEALAAAKSSALQDALNKAITAENYQTSVAYEEELRSYDQWRRGMIFANENSQGLRLFDLMSRLNPSLVKLVKDKKTAQAVGLPAARSANATKAIGSKLFARIPDLSTDKVLDVSDLVLPAGTGARVINRPEGGPRTKKVYYGSPTLNVVSQDFQHYILALSVFPGGLVQYAADIDYVRRQIGVRTGVVPPYDGTAPSTSIAGTAGAGYTNPELDPTYIPAVNMEEPSKVYPKYNKQQWQRMRQQKELEEQMQQLVLEAPLPPPVDFGGDLPPVIDGLPGLDLPPPSPPSPPAPIGRVGMGPAPPAPNRSDYAAIIAEQMAEQARMREEYDRQQLERPQTEEEIPTSSPSTASTASTRISEFINDDDESYQGEASSDEDELAILEDDE